MLFAFGSDPLSYYNKSAVNRSSNLSVWVNQPAPFDVRQTVLSAARGNGFWVACGNAGSAARITDNLVGVWASYDLDNRTNQFVKLKFTTQFVSVGFSRNISNLQEQAGIWLSANAANSGSWTRVYTGASGTYLMDLQVINNLTLVAVGWDQNQNVPIMLLTTNGGTSWQNVVLPVSWQGALTAVTYRSGVNAKIWVSGNNWIASSPWNLMSLTWNRTDLSGTGPVTNLCASNTHVTATQKNCVWYSSNDVDFESYCVLGYQFSSCTYAENQFVFGVHSLLNQYTLFTLDPDQISLGLVGQNMQVQANCLIDV